MEAQRSFADLQDTLRAERQERADRAAAGADALFAAAGELLRGLSGLRPVQDVTFECGRFLRDALESNGRYAAFHRSDAAGEVVCASLPMTDSRSVAEQEWFTRASLAQDLVVSGLQPGVVSQEQVLVVALPIRQGLRFDGAIGAGLRRDWLAERLRSLLPDAPGALFLFDSRGTLVAQTASGVDVEAALVAAGKRLAEGLTPPDPAAELDAYVAPLQAQGLRLVLVEPAINSLVGVRASLIVLAPVLVAALSFGVVWFALEAWVLRWHAHVAESARDYAAGRALSRMSPSAPDELQSLYGAFISAVAQSRARESEVSLALATNLRLSKELHHRVKNNLQILSSLAHRQQRRSPDANVRAALAETRARLLAVALVYRYLSGPEDLPTIDLQAYLEELSRQLHLVLGGELKGVTLTLDVKPAEAGVDEVAAIGLIVAECFIVAYAAAFDGSGARMLVRWRGASLEDAWMLEVGPQLARAVNAPLREFDAELIRQLSAQLDADASISATGDVRIRALATPEEAAAGAASSPSG